MYRKVNDVELYYEEFGEGKPLLMLHGSGENLEIFYKLIDKLKESYKIYAIDSRNHGKSTMTDKYSYNIMAEDIKAFIESLGYDKVNVLGFSDGAIIGILLGISNPNQLGKLILLGPNLNPKDMEEELLNKIKNKYEKTGDKLLKLMLSEPNIDIEDFKQIENEILLVFGENDIFKDEFIKEISKAVNNGKTKILEGHDHLSYIVDNDILAEDILDFL
ncbi:alpha/beta fold hydrolase [Anaerosphaera multitolerans]|uniref:Alpha/beta hydrolase n=1 Tax=Anaerosphaera multitolerans TaxID=2487351 RepID=A0A437S5X8_9FIRM|nr:alpha/beta hydrolase [Anaerosphaera multitolerans]RVU54452.1 alpha/beta hydrolase [Anaerosphaera multitolerans]